MSKELKLGLVIAASVLVLLVIITIIVLIKKRSKKNNKLEFPGLLEALGGTDNISNIVLNGSRISLNYANKGNVNKELIKENGVESIVVSNKKITLVVGKQAPIIYKYLQENLK